MRLIWGTRTSLLAKFKNVGESALAGNSQHVIQENVARVACGESQADLIVAFVMKLALNGNLLQRPSRECRRGPRRCGNSHPRRVGERSVAPWSSLTSEKKRSSRTPDRGRDLLGR